MASVDSTPVVSTFAAQPADASTTVVPLLISESTPQVAPAVVEPKMTQAVQRFMVLYMSQILNVINGCQEVAPIKAWIPMAFPGNLGKHLTAYLAPETDIVKTRRAIVTFLGLTIMDHVTKIKNIKDVEVTPWDIFANCHPELTFFGGGATLPIDIYHGTVKNAYPAMSEEMVAGLVLGGDFCKVVFADYCFTFEDFKDKYTNKTGKKFHAEIDGQQYYYNTADFTTGYDSMRNWSQAPNKITRRFMIQPDGSEVMLVL